MKVDANFSFSLQHIANTPKFLNAAQWRSFANMVSDNSGLARAEENVNPTYPNVDTDWVDAWTQNAPMYNADAAITGGNDHGSYAFSLGYVNQKGLTKESEYEKYTARTNSNWEFGRFFVSENAQVTWRRRTPTSTFNIGMPTLPIMDEQGRYASWGPEYYIESENARRNNPFAGLYARNQFTTNFDFMGGFSAGVKIIEGLRFTTSFSGNYTSKHGFTHTPVYYAKWNEDGSPDDDYGNPRNSLEESRNISSNYTWDNVLNFDRTFGKHGIQATLGQSWMREYYRYQSYSTINDLGATNIIGFSNIDGKISAGETNAALLSFFARVNYDFDGKYLLSASIRRDESSKFHKDYRTGYFPAASVGWNIHREKFLEGTAVSNLKLTASYSELGANFLSPYNFDDIAFGPIVYTTGGIRFTDGHAAYLKTKNLKWETSKTTDVGIELGLLNNEVTFHANYFYKKNVDLLANINLNLSSGQVFEINSSNETPYVNTASVENKGFEFMAAWHRGLTRDLRFALSANLTTLHNKVLALGDNVQPITSGSYSSKFNDAATITRPGDPIGSFYGYTIDGFDADGNFIFHDTDGNGRVTADDKVIIGNPIPDLSYGINLDVFYRDFDLTLFFQGVAGNDIFNARKYEYYFNYANNMVEDVLSSWTPRQHQHLRARGQGDQRRRRKLSAQHVLHRERRLLPSQERAAGLHSARETHTPLLRGASARVCKRFQRVHLHQVLGLRPRGELQHPLLARCGHELLSQRTHVHRRSQHQLLNPGHHEIFNKIHHLMRGCKPGADRLQRHLRGAVGQPRAAQHEGHVRQLAQLQLLHHHAAVRPYLLMRFAGHIHHRADRQR